MLGEGFGAKGDDLWEGVRDFPIGVLFFDKVGVVSVDPGIVDKRLVLGVL